MRRREHVLAVLRRERREHRVVRRLLPRRSSVSTVESARIAWTFARSRAAVAQSHSRMLWRAQPHGQSSSFIALRLGVVRRAVLRGVAAARRAHAHARGHVLAATAAGGGAACACEAMPSVTPATIASRITPTSAARPIRVFGFHCSLSTTLCGIRHTSVPNARIRKPIHTHSISGLR